MSEANRDEAMKCLGIARKARAEGDFAKAKRFAEKAKSLYPCAEVNSFLRSVQGGATSSYQRPSESTARQRSTAGAGTSSDANGSAGTPKAASTPAQKEAVKQILAAQGDYYKVLQVERDANEQDIKKAYRKIALKVHPDRCGAPGSEEAFKEVSKAFQCLTDPEKRAFYDRTGHEDPNAAAAASRGTGMHAQGVYRDLDPEELFNMMFGGGGLRGFGMGPMHFGGFSAGPGGFRQGPRQPQHEQDGQGFNFGGAFHLLIVLALLLITILSQSSAPAAVLHNSPHYPDKILTEQRGVPFFVKSRRQFEQRFPHRTPKRWRLERQLELDYQMELTGRCRAELVRDQRERAAINFMGKDSAGRFVPPERPSCDLLQQMFGPSLRTI